MNSETAMSVLVVANILELSSRVLTKSVGNDLSSQVDNTNVYDDAEVLIATKLRQRLIAKVA